MSTPGNGSVAEPGASGTRAPPACGETIAAPVSVCHHVSTTGSRSAPMWARYHLHASGLIASPTEPSNRSEPRSWALAHASPYRMCIRIAVGEV